MTVIARYVVEIDGDVLGREGDVPSAEQDLVREDGA